jgi:8-oxo-dGTP diphosphatase
MSENVAQEKDTYFVAVKVFLEDGRGQLLALKDKFGDWDLPGGRLREMDFATPLEEVIARKMQEEVGGDVRYRLGEPVVFMRHERVEASGTYGGQKRRIFAIGYTATYMGGEIALGEYMEKFEWLPIDALVPEDYFAGGWLQGVKDYLEKRRNK